MERQLTLPECWGPNSRTFTTVIRLTCEPCSFQGVNSTVVPLAGNMIKQDPVLMGRQKLVLTCAAPGFVGYSWDLIHQWFVWFLRRTSWPQLQIGLSLTKPGDGSHSKHRLGQLEGSCKTQADPGFSVVATEGQLWHSSRTQLDNKAAVLPKILRVFPWSLVLFTVC